MPQWLESCRLDSSTPRRLTARRLDGWHGGSMAERLDSLTLVGLTTQQLDGATAQQLNGSTALWLDGLTARQMAW
jgi:hypothetical protein